MVFLLDKNDIWFPDPTLAEDDGLLAVGGDLSINRLLLAYQYGIFPWYAFRHNDILWYCPKDRFVIFPKEIHISHSMKKLVKSDKYSLTMNKDFEGVINNCSKLRIDNECAWLGEDMIKAYINLHKHNLSTSVEVWDSDNNLVGGLYGVTIGMCFVGESMFSLVPNASKLALIYLAERMTEFEGSFIDCQFETPHLKSMGGRFISYLEYIKLLTNKKD